MHQNQLGNLSIMHPLQHTPRLTEPAYPWMCQDVGMRECIELGHIDSPLASPCFWDTALTGGIAGPEGITEPGLWSGLPIPMTSCALKE